MRRAKGFKWMGKNKERAARERILRAGKHSFQDRRKKKRVNRALWNVKINAALRSGHGISYSKFIHQLKKAHIEINRKMLAEFAEHRPDTFSKIVESVHPVTK